VRPLRKVQHDPAGMESSAQAMIIPALSAILFSPAQLSHEHSEREFIFHHSFLIYISTNTTNRHTTEHTIYEPKAITNLMTTLAL